MGAIPIASTISASRQVLDLPNSFPFPTVPPARKTWCAVEGGELGSTDTERLLATRMSRRYRGVYISANFIFGEVANDNFSEALPIAA